MILYSKDSKGFYINLLADFVLKKLDKSNSIVKIYDFNNFVVFKGKTSSKEILNLNEVLNEFNSLNDNQIKFTNSIDLIEYGVELEKTETLIHSYFNSENCLYSKKQLEYFTKSKSTIHFLHFDEINNDSLVTCSEFPFGYSFNQGRLLYYYGKYIFYNIPTCFYSEFLTFNLTQKIDENGDIEFKIFNPFGLEDDILTSSILDAFDFDMNWIENEMKKVDWSLESSNPLSEYEFLKKTNKDLIII